MLARLLQGPARFSGHRVLPPVLQQLDDRLYTALSRAHSPLLDRLMPALSHAADHGKLWAGIAGALSLGGGGRGQRAARRGMAALAVTSAVVNGPVKLLVRRARPSFEGVPTVRRLLRMPTSSSFPSGHTASAAAFAVAAGLEMREAAAPLGMLATAVGVSRVYTGAHYPIDVLAGAAAGAGVALVMRGTHAVRDASKGPDPVKPVRTIDVGEGEGVVLAGNPSAGPALASDPLEVAAKQLPSATRVELNGDVSDALRRVSGDGTVALAVSGGDGTINAAAAVARERGVTLGVLPGGTLNHFARDIGVGEPDDAAAAIAGGAVGSVDLGCIDGKPFLNTASFGLYTDLVDERERLESKIGKWPAAFVAFAKVMRKREPIRVEIDGRRMRVWMVFFGNGGYSSDRMAPVRRESLDGGLDVRVVRADRTFPRLRALLAVGPVAMARAGVLRRWRADSVRVRSFDGPLRLARDGETFDGPAEFEVIRIPGALDVFVPAPAKETTEADANGAREPAATR